MPGVPEFYAQWPKRDVVGWQGEDPAPMEKAVNSGGVWTGGKSDDRLAIAQIAHRHKSTAVVPIRSLS